MRIVHGSDWHGEMMQCPEADIYVFTGDMLDNYPIVKWVDGRMQDWPKIDPEHERKMQRVEMAAIAGFDDVGFRSFLGSPDAPIVCVRGNHDFVDLAPMFKGCNLVHEFFDNEVVDVLGLKVTGHRGIPYIYGGWSDEETRTTLFERVSRMPPADLFLTHYPPEGVFDSGGPGHPSYGLQYMEDAMQYKAVGTRRAVHCFGHIHEAGGKVARVGNVTFSNAACHVNVIDI